MMARERLAGVPLPPQGSRFAHPAPPACGLDRAPPLRLFRLQALMATRERDRSRNGEEAAALPDRPAPALTIRPPSAPCEVSCIARAEKSRRRLVGNAGAAPSTTTTTTAMGGRQGACRVGPLRFNPATSTVTDDRPEFTPATESELDMSEAWFGYLFDEIFAGPVLRSQLRCTGSGDRTSDTVRAHQAGRCRVRVKGHF